MADAGARKSFFQRFPPLVWIILAALLAWAVYAWSQSDKRVTGASGDGMPGNTDPGVAVPGEATVPTANGANAQFDEARPDTPAEGATVSPALQAGTPQPSAKSITAARDQPIVEQPADVWVQPQKK
ncbi:MAG TPA: hypothetical protein VD929_03880 [Caulobacteraceae bacterium]|nr:hypothetical protein [Caulobacteraceae bacterium]